MTAKAQLLSFLSDHRPISWTLDYSGGIQAVVNLGGPPDLVSGYRDSTSLGLRLSSFLGGRLEDVPAAYRDASPVTNLRCKRCAKARAAGALHSAAFSEGGHATPPDVDLWNEVMYGFFDIHLNSSAGLSVGVTLVPIANSRKGSHPTGRSGSGALACRRCVGAPFDPRQPREIRASARSRCIQPGGDRQR